MQVSFKNDGQHEKVFKEIINYLIMCKISRYIFFFYNSKNYIIVIRKLFLNRISLKIISLTLVTFINDLREGGKQRIFLRLHHFYDSQLSTNVYKSEYLLTTQVVSTQLQRINEFLFFFTKYREYIIIKKRFRHMTILKLLLQYI